MIYGLIFGLLAGFGLGWFCCETRVWRQIKKASERDRARLQREGRPG